MIHVEYKDIKYIFLFSLNFPSLHMMYYSQNVPAIVEFAWCIKVSRAPQASQVEPPA